MKRLFLAAVLAAVASGPASAATLYVGHGIDGRDLGAAKELPVDVCLVTGGVPAPLFEGVPFGAFAKIDADLPAGRYDVEVRLVGASACAGPVAIAASVFLGFGENATAFAHLNEQGAPTLTKFTNDVRPLAAGQTPHLRSSRRGVRRRQRRPSQRQEDGAHPGPREPRPGGCEPAGRHLARRDLPGELLAQAGVLGEPAPRGGHGLLRLRGGLAGERDVHGAAAGHRHPVTTPRAYR